jgi:uncharacterized membrane protein YqaE (UPF0057 family)
MNDLLKSRSSLVRIAIAIIVAHVVVGTVHGTAHVAMGINMSLAQNLYILIVIWALPVVSGLLLWRRRARAGFVLLCLSMLGALPFGAYYHFVATGADNVGSLGHHLWALPFQITAVLLALTEAAGSLVGLLGARRVRVSS